MPSPKLPSRANSTVEERVEVSRTRVQVTSGPIPSPETLAQYERAVPGLAQQIVEAFEAEYRTGITWKNWLSRAVSAQWNWRTATADTASNSVSESARWRSCVAPRCCIAATTRRVRTGPLANSLEPTAAAAHGHPDSARNSASATGGRAIPDACRSSLRLASRPCTPATRGRTPSAAGCRRSR